MGFDPAGFISTAATGGAWSTDGNSGYMNGGKGMLDAYNKNFDTSSFTDWIPGVGDAAAAHKQNAANQANAQKQMDFQERMSNTAYQRATYDMKKAGINPMLAFSQGGASTPSGALPTVNSETKTKLGEFALNSATGLMGARTQQQQANTQQDVAVSSINLNNANSAKQVAETRNTQLDSEMKKRELKGRRLSETVDKAAGGVVQKLIDSISNSAKNSSAQKTKEPLIKVLGPGPKSKGLIKN